MEKENTCADGSRGQRTPGDMARCSLGYSRCLDGECGNRDRDRDRDRDRQERGRVQGQQRRRRLMRMLSGGGGAAVGSMDDGNGCGCGCGSGYGYGCDGLSECGAGGGDGDGDGVGCDGSDGGDASSNGDFDGDGSGNGNGNGNGNGAGLANTHHTESDWLAATTNPNMNTFSRALGCYPIIREVARQLDLNTLHDLSRTCRQVRANLLQHRRQLVRRSLRCVNDTARDVGNVATSETYQRHQRQGWQQARLDGRTPESASQRGGASICARDMVKECRRCGTVVCRNCTIKPPGKESFNRRHRRLCQVCQSVPLEMLTEPLHFAISSTRSKFVANGTTEPRPAAGAGAGAAGTAAVSLTSLTSPSNPDSDTSHLLFEQKQHPTELNHGHDYHLKSQIQHQQENLGPDTSTQTPTRSFTYDAFRRDPCQCADSVWLCNECGRTLRSATLMYNRGWLWRKRYSDYLGGRNSGVGEGSEGVHCGREMYCLDAKEVEHVIEWNDRGKSSGLGASPAAAGSFAAGIAETGIGNGEGQAGSVAIDGVGVGNGYGNGNETDGSNSVNGPAVAGGEGGSSITTSDYIEVGGGGFGSSHDNDHDHHDHDGHMSSTHVHFDTGANATMNTNTSTKSRHRHEPSYYAQEVEGIGGVVRRTTYHRERVGAVVPEYEGERATGQFLKAEHEGDVRSWCSWCFRVLPGKEDT